MRFDLKAPCRNCPFRRDETRIRFSGRERATEIAESAYRYGFPCHLSAEVREHDDGDCVAEYVPGENSQHCAGALAMFAKEYTGSPWPGIDNDEDALTAIEERLEPIFDLVFTEEEFIEANYSARFDEESADD